jgi:alcohol dehydrogenase class IV
MSRVLGARHGVAHGSGNAILLPHVMRFNAERPEGAKRLQDVAAALGLSVPKDPVEAANAAADKVSELLVATGHSVKLAEIKVPNDDLEATAESAFLDPANLYNARVVSFPAEITELYQGAY